MSEDPLLISTLKIPMFEIMLNLEKFRTVCVFGGVFGWKGGWADCLRKKQ
jgi:hypothetical protein